MAVQKVADLRRQALTELSEYRRRSIKLRKDKIKDRRRMRGWIRVIDSVRAALSEEEPEKERFMAELFGFDHALPRRSTARERLMQLARDMNRAEATLYNWRAEIVELVLLAALEEGLVHLFRVGKGGRARKKTL